MRRVFRVGCACGALTFCNATAMLPHACAFCGRALPDSTAARLQALRACRGLSTNAIALRVGVARTTAYEWEIGRRPIPADRRIALAAQLQVAPELLDARVATSTPTQEVQMEPELEPTPGSIPSCPSAPTPTVEQAEPTPSAGIRCTMRFTVELACLLCGRELGELESDVWPTCRVVLLRQAGAPPVQVIDWRRLRCATCGGAAVTNEITQRLIRPEAPIDWSTERPRRGRPPKSLAARRGAGSPAA